MSNVDELIDENCSDGVEFRALGDLAQTVSGLSGKTKADFSNGNARFVSYKNAFANLVVNQQARDFVAIRPGERQNRLHEGDVVFTGSSESTADVGMSSVVTSEPTESLYLNSFCFALRFNDPELFLPHFSKYLFRGEAIRKQIRATSSGVTRINISKSRFLKVRIPVPPLEVQRGIVRILDQFTQLEAELEAKLEAELEARHRQYKYYRNSLLSFRGAKWVRRTPMGELGMFVRGRRFTKNDFVVEGIPSIHYGEIYTQYGVATTSTVSHVRADLASQLRYAQPGDVVFASVGETVEDVAKAVAWLGDEPVAIHDDTFLFRSQLNPKFVSYFAQTADFHGQKNRLVARAKVKRVSGEGLAKIAIPVPSLEAQERIVAILDDFNALLNDLSIGLPAERVARRKQYEFYRDRLLTFDEAVA